METTWQSLFTGMLIFIGLGIGFTLIISSVLPNDTSVNPTSAALNSIKQNMTEITGQADVADENAKPSTSDSILNPLGAVGSVLGKFKAVKNVILSIQKLGSTIFDWFPSFVWWIIAGILVLIPVFLTLRAWLRIET